MTGVDVLLIFIHSQRYVIQAFSQLKQLVTLSIDASFTAGKEQRQFTNYIARVCTKLEVIALMRPQQLNPYPFRRVVLGRGLDTFNMLDTEQDQDVDMPMPQVANAPVPRDEGTDVELFFGNWDDGYDAKSYAITWGRTKADRAMKFRQTHGIQLGNVDAVAEVAGPAASGSNFKPESDNGSTGEIDAGEVIEDSRENGCSFSHV